MCVLDFLIHSFIFTLSSGMADNSSASLYRTISTLETKILDESRVVRQGQGRNVSDEDLQQQKWTKLISDHKHVPASLWIIPSNIIIHYALDTRIPQTPGGLEVCLVFLVAPHFEHLQDFIYYAYTFYAGLLEEPTLHSFRSGWLEALGDLARYRMAVAH
ncbi:hypothetical protein F4604DRAFT_1922927 [Suillus subluteus]|nr:hypothetical protein F4604DRAFT_1922927 [Suillus subluteus]